MANEVTAPRTPPLHWSLANIGIEAQRRRTDADGLIPLSQAAANLKIAPRTIVRPRSARTVLSVFRVPATADLKTLFNTGNVPESVLKDRVQTAGAEPGWRRKNASRALEVGTRYNEKIFPAAGFDEAEYEKAVDVSDRTKSIKASRTPDQGCRHRQTQAENRHHGLHQIGRRMRCRSDQSRIGIRLQTLHRQTRLRDGQGRPDHGRESHRFFRETDYNLDDPETGLGGWADYASQHIHLESAVARVTNVNEAKVTIIHEACHLANPTVDDKGYYGGAGFEAARGYKGYQRSSLRRYPGANSASASTRKFSRLNPASISSSVNPSQEPSPIYYDPFKPGASASGAALTFEQKVRANPTTI